MNNINSIVDYKKHPINDIDYIHKCNSLIKKNSLLVLENFLSNKSLINILYEPFKVCRYSPRERL